MTKIKESAIKMLQLGFSVLPTNLKTKRPTLTKWKALQDSKMSYDDAEMAFDDEVNIAVICGKVSGNLECIDFDNHTPNIDKIFEGFKQYVDTFGLYCEKTLNDGYHILYRCEDPVSGNTKLASVLDSSRKPTAIIETRGEGGYVIISPSEGYDIIDGSFDSLPIITKEQRDLIISECIRYNEVLVDEYSENRSMDTPNLYGVGDRIGDRYNSKSSSLSDCRNLLISAGWKFDKNGIDCTRPDKDIKDGFSATLGRVKSRMGIPQFYVFSSNAYPFQPMTGYTPFAVRTILSNGGDYKASAIELAKEEGSYNLPSLKKQERNVSVTVPSFVNETEKKILMSIPSSQITSVPNNQPKPKISMTYSNTSNTSSTLGFGLSLKESVPDKKPKIDLAMDFLTKHYDFRRDCISNIIEYKPKDAIGSWSLANENTLYVQLQHYGIDVKQNVVSALLGSEYVQEYNPFNSYFESLREWDGVNYFAKLASYIDVEDKAFFIAMLEKQFVRAIKCAREDDFYNRFVFVFRDRNQETGKSRLVRYLNPFGDKYYTEEFLESSKDAQIALSETFIYNLDDLDDFKRVGGLGKLKSILAKSSINVRLPYGKQKVKLYRHCTFFGSTNMQEFLVDDINTRWLVFNIKKINFDLFKEVDINDLWAQAWMQYNNPKFNWDLTIQEKEKREDMNQRHKQSLMEQMLIADKFRVPEGSKRLMTLADICKELSTLGSYTRLNTDPTYIQDILAAMGFEPEIKIIMNTYIKMYNIERIPQI